MPITYEIYDLNTGQTLATRVRYDQAKAFINETAKARHQPKRRLQIRTLTVDGRVIRPQEGDKRPNRLVSVPDAYRD